MKRFLTILGWTFASLSILLFGCAEDDGNNTDTSHKTLMNGGGVEAEWMQLAMDRVKADKLNPPLASRTYAYFAVAYYEAVVPGIPEKQSLYGRLNGMPAMPKDGDIHDWPTVGAAAITTAAQTLFAAPESKAAFIHHREQQIHARQNAEIADTVIQNSVKHGESVGNAIASWSKGDGFDATRGRPFVPPSGPSNWVPTNATTNPLEPYWGTLRPFCISHGGAIPCPPPPEYSEEANSEFYQQEKEVYEVGKSLTDEQKTIALFWADGPGETMTPPGHWIAICGQLIDQRHLGLDKTAEMYALVSVSMADAFISCWFEKYRYNLLRPVTYINRLIDPEWKTLIATPAFPTYTSGHSTSSGAASTVLTGLFGKVAFTDRTHESRGFAARSFPSFEAAASEAAVSRLYGGIHLKADNENGLAQGQEVGKAVLARVQ